MKKILTLLFLFFMLVQVAAQSAAPNLIISEIFFGAAPYTAYIEITNLGNEDADLSKVFLGFGSNGEKCHSFVSTTRTWRLDDPAFEKRMPGNVLPAGQSMIIVNNQWNLDNLDNQVDAVAPFYKEVADIIFPYVKNTGSYQNLRLWNGDDWLRLSWDKNGDGDYNWEVGVDELLDMVGISSDYGSWNGVYEIAGVPDAPLNHVLVRKTSVEQGNGGNFTLGMGVSPDDSEWILIAWNYSTATQLYTTAGVHGDDFSTNFDIIGGSLNETAGTAEMPWGVERSSIQTNMEFGANHAWGINWGPDTLNSNLVQTNDTLVIYIPGNQLQTEKYIVTQSNAPVDMNRLFSRFSIPIIADIPFDWPDYIKKYKRGNMNVVYNITTLEEGMDTIGMVGGEIGYATSVDTILKYTEIAPTASIKHITKDGVDRSYVMDGDMFEIKAQDESVKKYYIKARDKAFNRNVYLSQILIDNKRIPGFERRNTYYEYTLEAGATSFPDITYIAEDKNATVTMERPVSLRGNRAQRTAKIHIMAEDQEYTNSYMIVFNKADENIQPNRMDPIISEGYFGGAWDKAVEIANIGNVPLDLSDYILGLGVRSTSAAAFIGDLTFGRKFRPGYKLDRDNPSGIYYKGVNLPFSTILDPGQVFVITTGWHHHRSKGRDEFMEFSDWGIRNNHTSHEEFAFHEWFPDGGSAWPNFSTSYTIWKIENDAIFNGLKSGDQLADHQLIDVLGAVGASNNKTVEGVTYGSDPRISLIRKPGITQGNTENFGSFGTTAGTGEWIVEECNQIGNDFWLGGHYFVPSTDFSSKIYSNAYLVSTGYSLDETISAVNSGTTVEQFKANIIKDHSNQILELVDGTGGSLLEPDAELSAGDKLNVTSADGKNQSTYILSLGSLDNNALLESTVYEINVNEAIGTIKDIEPLSSLEEIIDNITVPSTVSSFNVVNSENELVPLKSSMLDTLVFFGNTGGVGMFTYDIHKDPPSTYPFINTPTLADDQMYFEVIAEDGKTKIMYRLNLNEGDPYLTSDVYNVIQDRHVIYMLPGSNVGGFLNNVKPSKGASIKVYDAAGFEKTDPYVDIFVTDEVSVFSASKSVTYTFEYIETELLSNISSLSDLQVSTGTLAPVFDSETLEYDVVVPSNTNSLTITVAKTDPESTVEGDGLIEFTDDTSVDIVVTAEDGSTTTYTVNITIAVSVSDFTANSVRIYPNPVTSEYFINLGKNETGVNVKMTNITGSVIFNNIESSDSVIRVNAQSLTPGVYFVTITKEDAVVTKKIIKQ